MTADRCSRRAFLARSAALAAPLTVASSGTADEPRGKAEACIFLWLGGGACHIDTFDPKRRGDGKKVAGSYYDPIDTAVSGVQVCEHLPRIAAMMDRLVLVRTLNHNVIDEHAAAVHRLHTGRPISETVVYPSVGSVIAHERGSRGETVPPYVVIGYPSVSRGPGFLGPAAGYLYLTETEAGPPALTPLPDVDAARRARRESLLGKIGGGYLKRTTDAPAPADYAAAAGRGFRLAGPAFMGTFDLATEPASLREAYGGEFGQRCLLARRLVERGVRFVEVSFNLNFTNGTGWDTHNEGQLNQHLLIQELDRAFTALISDLERKRLLESTLVVVATEFGRPPEFDGGGGRGHHSKAFCAVLAGGGLRTGRAIGVTDELGKLPVEKPVSVPDFHATIYAALGIDPAGELYAGERPVPITDGGRPIAELFPRA